VSEHRPPPLKETVLVPDMLPAQLLVEKQLEGTTTIKDLPAEEMNLPDDRPPRAFPSLTPVAEPEDTNVAEPEDTNVAELEDTIVAEPEDPAYQRPQRERHPPRRITYDQLGRPSLYSIQPQPQLFSVYPAPGLVPWLPSPHQYYLQPPCMYGLQQS